MGKPKARMLKTITDQHKIIIALRGQDETESLEELYSNITTPNVVVKHFYFPDFHAPKLDEYAAFFEMYDEAIQANPNASPVIHCGAGNGRTGTMIAALMIREAITTGGAVRDNSLGNDSPIEYQLSAFDNRSRFQPTTILGRLFKRILLLFFPLPLSLRKPDTQDYHVCALVHQTLDTLRKSRPESVETAQQLDSLDRLAKALADNAIPKKDNSRKYYQDIDTAAKPTVKPLSASHLDSSKRPGCFSRLCSSYNVSIPFFKNLVGIKPRK